MPTLRPTRRRRLLAALAALLALGGGLWWLVSSGRISRANYDRVRASKLDEGTGEFRHDGMTYEEVVAILGPPTDSLLGPALPDGLPLRICEWDTFGVYIEIDFFGSGIARHKLYSEFTLWDGLQRWWIRTRVRLGLR
jgi:hypothetical protein